MVEHQTLTVARPNRFSSSHSVFRADTTKGERRRAVLAGINDYHGAANDLPSSVNDVNAFEEVLKNQYGFDEIVRLVDSEATIANVTAALRELFADVSPDDRLVFFFSGHGTTALRGHDIEECIVLYDGYLFDDAFVQMTQNLPPGILTLVADCCFSGGLEKRMLAPVFKYSGLAAGARVKTYMRPTGDKFVDHTNGQDRAIAKKRFGEMTYRRNSPVAANSRDPLAGWQASMPAAPSDETGQLLFNGVLLSACLETETAAASTALTEGKSAFTFALLHSLKALGPRASLAELVHAAKLMIERVGLPQTPLLKEPKIPVDTRLRSFITFARQRSSVI
ncbi:hypothetical protein CDO26_36635 (plasmid) [Sinorhizobium meliloti]|uniref:caspase family protein n=1 Tax=Rhizobium meliloti TaxID=382 RepID=UPI000B49942E|nr:caspase family protein [Sinorhizobium meliloti]ASP89638.1 hypothetical protein CDO26_36635 [Sinorhizobium meliloti]MQW27799.1 hypothetical protein [Sinorhizobium meliloti]